MTGPDTQADHVLVGTSSWTDKTLIESGKFYPRTATTPEERLRFYASQPPDCSASAPSDVCFGFR